MDKPLVLVVDDEALIAVEMETALSEGGFTAALGSSCCKGRGALLANHMPAAAVLDVRLWDGESVEAARMLAARGVPFVVYSGLGPEQSDEAFSLGTVVMKPTEPEELVRILGELIAGRKPRMTGWLHPLGLRSQCAFRLVAHCTLTAKQWGCTIGDTGADKEHGAQTCSIGSPSQSRASKSHRDIQKGRVDAHCQAAVLRRCATKAGITSSWTCRRRALPGSNLPLPRAAISTTTSATALHFGW
nr:hypothetical protein [Mesorhizobium sp. B283B1A]